MTDQEEQKAAEDLARQLASIYAELEPELVVGMSAASVLVTSLCLGYAYCEEGQHDPEGFRLARVLAETHHKNLLRQIDLAEASARQRSRQ